MLMSYLNDAFDKIRYKRLREASEGTHAFPHIILMSIHKLSIVGSGLCVITIICGPKDISFRT